MKNRPTVAAYRLLEKQLKRARAHQDQLRVQGNWFQFFRGYLKIMSLEEAVVIQSLLNFSLFAKDQYRLEEDPRFVLCTHNHLQSVLYMERRAQDRVIKSLVSKGFLQTKRAGLPARRYIKVDTKTIDKKLDDAKPCKLDCAKPYKQQSAEPYRYKEDSLRSSSPKKKNNVGELRSHDGVCSPSSNGFIPNPEQIGTLPHHHKWANRLFEALAQKRKIMRKGTSISKWARVFSQIELVQPKQVIEDVLTWYLPNIGGNYIPEVYSAQSFMDKFPNLEQAMIRHSISTCGGSGPKETRDAFLFKRYEIPSPRDPNSSRQIYAYLPGHSKYQKGVNDVSTVLSSYKRIKEIPL